MDERGDQRNSANDDFDKLFCTDDYENRFNIGNNKPTLHQILLAFLCWA